jgi:hypothetical protein
MSRRLWWWSKMRITAAGRPAAGTSGQQQNLLDLFRSQSLSSDIDSIDNRYNLNSRPIITMPDQRSGYREL